jgi:hypothetical protein
LSIDVWVTAGRPTGWICSYADGIESTYFQQRNTLQRVTGFADNGPASTVRGWTPLGNDPVAAIREMLARRQLRDAGEATVAGRAVHRLVGTRTRRVGSQLVTTRVEYDVAPDTFTPVQARVELPIPARAAGQPMPNPSVVLRFLTFQQLPLTHATRRLLAGDFAIAIRRSRRSPRALKRTLLGFGSGLSPSIKKRPRHISPEQTNSGENRVTPGVFESPLPDSNRRPLPYHRSPDHLASPRGNPNSRERSVRSAGIASSRGYQMVRVRSRHVPGLTRARVVAREITGPGEPGVAGRGERRWLRRGCGRRACARRRAGSRGQSLRRARVQRHRADRDGVN